MMRIESPLAVAAAVVDERGAPLSWRRRGDLAALVLLVALPTVVFGVPALLGHAVFPGDDLTQNLPLRMLAGREIRAGHLPLFDPYTWSGAPLLAGWNAAAAYPLTWLFAILPATGAWTVNMVATWAVAGLGMFCLLRAFGLASLAGFLGAFSFAFAGGMSAQVSHFGLVAGMSWVPVGLLSILRLSQERPAASRLCWTALLATVAGMVILAGEPRAIDDACVILGIYAVWRVARLGRRAGPAAVSVAAGLALGACLGAVQWLPGLTAISSSERGADSLALYSSGSLPVRWVLLTLVPDLLGGSGSLSQPSFLAFYNLTEVTSYVGILPLVAAFALLGRLRWRSRPPEWIVWHVMALAGVALALGGNTPLGDLLYHLPLFGDQRLQSRNILVLDLALAVLLAYWADRPSGGQHVRPTVRETVLGLAPALAAVVVVALGLTWGAGFLHWAGMGASPGAGIVGRLKPWLIPYAALGAGAAALVLAARHLGPDLRSRLIAWFVVVDVLVFTTLCVVEIGPGVFASSDSSGDSQAGGSVSATAQAVAGQTATASLRPVGALGYPGRFVIYDPGLLDPGELSGLDPPDVNAVSANPMPSVQGYSSTVDGHYASVTGSHEATGDGQDTLSPRAVADGTLDQLDTSVLLTLSSYLTTAGRNGPAVGTGGRDVAAYQRATWYLGATRDVSEVEVPDPDARRDAAAGTQLGLVAPGGSTQWFRVRAITASYLAISVSRPVAAVAVVAQAHGTRCSLGTPSMTTADGGVVVANGQLQSALVPPRWTFAGFDGSFAIFANHRAQPPLVIQALPGRPAAGAWVRAAGGAPADPTAAAVFSPHGARVVRSVTAIAGWSARWQPQHGPAARLTVQPDGLIQAVDVPAGRGVLTWSYTPPGFRTGLALSSCGAVALAGLFFLAAYFARKPASHRDSRIIPAKARRELTYPPFHGR